MSFASQQVTVFNKILLSFLKDIRKKDDGIKQLLRENYKIFDKRSEEYILFVREQMSEAVYAPIRDGADLFESEAILGVQIFRQVTVGEIANKVIGGNQEDVRIMKLYVYMLFTILYFDTLDLEDKERSILLTKTFRIMNGEQVDMDEILDDAILKIMTRVEALRESGEVEEVNVQEGEGSDPLGLDFMRNTKIGELAEEITASIDLGELKQEDMMNPEKLFSGDNNVLSGIIQSVGSTIQTKIEKGELNQEELLTEAMGMMGNLKNSGHGDMMADMFKMMSTMSPDGAPPSFEGGGGKSRGATHERLRKRLAEK